MENENFFYLSGEKNFFENPTKFDRIRAKNVFVLTIFQRPAAPLEEINEYILTFTAFNLEIDWLLILLLYKRILLTLVSTFFVRSISWNYVWQMLLFSKNILDILIQFKLENITSLFTNLTAWNSCPNLMTLSKDRSIYYSNTKIPWWNHHQ